MWLALALAWGTFNLFLTVGNSLDYESDGLENIASEERDWRFGQLLPVILLALPFLTIWESYIGK